MSISIFSFLLYGSAKMNHGMIQKSDPKMNFNIVEFMDLVMTNEPATKANDIAVGIRNDL